MHTGTNHNNWIICFLYKVKIVISSLKRDKEKLINLIKSLRIDRMVLILRFDQSSRRVIKAATVIIINFAPS